MRRVPSSLALVLLLSLSAPARAQVPGEEIAVVLLVTYVLSLVFTLRTHRSIYGTLRENSRSVTENGTLRENSRSVTENVSDGSGSIRRWVVVLLAATAGVAVVSELMVGAVAATAHDLGMTELFVGVVVVALVGNAAEHVSAVTLAAADHMDAALAIAVGSSTQIALFVAPVLVLLSYLVGPSPMNLQFWPGAVVMMLIAALTASLVTNGGRSTWFVGVLALMVYATFAMTLYLLPPTAQ
jgi:Ca2+:H+ antiporter